MERKNSQIYSRDYCLLNLLCSATSVLSTLLYHNDNAVKYYHLSSRDRLDGSRMFLNNSCFHVNLVIRKWYCCIGLRKSRNNYLFYLMNKKEYYDKVNRLNLQKSLYTDKCCEKKYFSYLLLVSPDCLLLKHIVNFKLFWRDYFNTEETFDTVVALARTPITYQKFLWIMHWCHDWIFSSKLGKGKQTW